MIRGARGFALPFHAQGRFGRRWRFVDSSLLHYIRVVRVGPGRRFSSFQL